MRKVKTSYEHKIQKHLRPHPKCVQFSYLSYFEEFSCCEHDKAQSFTYFTGILLNSRVLFVEKKKRKERMEDCCLSLKKK